MSTIDVTAFKWNWDFGYPGTTVPGGGEVHTIGNSEEVPILVLPVNKLDPVPAASPRTSSTRSGRSTSCSSGTCSRTRSRTRRNNVFQNTIDTTGAFVGRCAELCGTYHSAMNFEVRAVPQDVYDAYLDLRQTINPVTGQAYSAADALRGSAQEIPSCGELCAPLATTTYPLNTDRTAKAATEPPTGGN